MNEIEKVLTRGVSQVLPDKKGLASLMSKKKIKLYQGFDPSMPSLHLGNIVGLMKLRQFQKLGHEVIFLVGDFTGMIGDPTDKLAVRKKLAREQVLENAKSWKEQAGRILDFDGKNPAKIIFNSSWSDKITFRDLIEITSHVSYAQLIERDMFQERIKKGEEIRLHELLYPIAQGYDSVAMGVDLEIGGSDQLFNMMMGRTLIKSILGKEKYVLTTKLLVDSEGKKVGKTTGNAIFLDSTPSEFFAGIMGFPDDVTFLGFELLTDARLSDLAERIKKDPMTAKKDLAFDIVKTLWSEKSAEKAKEAFENTFQKREIPKNIKSLKVSGLSMPLLDLMFSTKLASSRSEAKRLISQGAVDANGVKIMDPAYKIELPATLKVGKSKFLRIEGK